MPRGDKSSYTGKQRRQASHIEDSEKAQGRSGRTAARIAWATVNKQDGGGKKSGGGRSGAMRSHRPARRPKATTRTRRTTRSRPAGRARA